ncbi:hypothetical protein J6590_038096 [Homalodisca vitripennis]|nr:hypothetical protein J6590_038096 [Homalodisca vitripennis]
MERRRIQWMGHVKRVGDNRMPRIALEEERGRRPRGRRRKEEEDQEEAERKMGGPSVERHRDKGTTENTDKSGGGCVRRPVITDDDDELYQRLSKNSILSVIFKLTYFLPPLHIAEEKGLINHI